MSNRFWLFKGNAGDTITSKDFTGFESIEAAKTDFEQSGMPCGLIVESPNPPSLYDEMNVDFVVRSAWGSKTNGWRDFNRSPESWGEIWQG